MTIGLALTYLFVLLGTVTGVYVFFIYPMMKSSYENVTKKILPTFIASMIKKYKAPSPAAKVSATPAASTASTASTAPTASTASTASTAPQPRKYTATEWTAAQHMPKASAPNKAVAPFSSLLGRSYQ